MKSTYLLFLLATAAISNAQDIDITQRAVTDPLLKITSLTTLLPEKDDKGLGAKRDEKHVPPLYARIWNKQDVFMLEPLSLQKPAEIDFSAITKNAKGVLRLSARNHPGGDFALEIFQKGKSVKREIIGSDKWEKFTVPFDHEEVVVKNVANGWYYEFGFIDYSIGK